MIVVASNDIRYFITSICFLSTTKFILSLSLSLSLSPPPLLLFPRRRHLEGKFTSWHKKKSAIESIASALQNVLLTYA